MKEGREFELGREKVAVQSILLLEIWNAREHIIVLYRGSANRLVSDDRRRRGRCKELEEYAHR